MPLSLLKEPHFITVVFPDKQERPEEQGPHPTQGGRFSLRSVFGVGGISQPGHFLSSGNILTPAHIQIVRGPLTCAENGSASTPGVVTMSWSLGETAGELPASTRVLRADCVRLPWDAPTPWTGPCESLVWTAVSVAASGVCGVSTPQLGLLRVEGKGFPDVRPRASEQFIQSYARLHEGSTLPPLPPSHYTES